MPTPNQVLKTLKLWWIHRQIRAAEREEKERLASLRYLQASVLPKLRERRNAITYR